MKGCGEGLRGRTWAFHWKPSFAMPIHPRGLPALVLRTAM